MPWAANCFLAPASLPSLRSLSFGLSQPEQLPMSLPIPSKHKKGTGILYPVAKVGIPRSLVDISTLRSPLAVSLAIPQENPPSQSGGPSTPRLSSSPPPQTRRRGELILLALSP